MLCLKIDGKEASAIVIVLSLLVIASKVLVQHRSEVQVSGVT